MMPREMLTANVGHVFSMPAMREVMTGTFDGKAARSLQHLASSGALPIASDATFGDGVAAFHAWMSRNYRNEHIYKNVIANKILLGRHSINTATMLAEFRVGGSVADCVVVNGEATAYEIKTELDTPTRLRKQLDEYMTVFARTVVVTDESLVDRYANLLSDRPTGLLALNRRGSLTEVVSPVDDESNLSVEAMFKSLRKPEYTHAVTRLSDVTPDVPNTQHFRACLAVARQFTAPTFHTEFLSALRCRRLAEGVDDPALRNIRHLCFKLMPRTPELDNILSWLGHRIAACTTPISAESSTNSSH